jgi:hypothetical protein
MKFFIKIGVIYSLLIGLQTYLFFIKKTILL